MLKVDNKHVINEIVINSFKANKLRNIFVVVAITLTTILFTSLFTIGENFINSIQQSTMRQAGTSAHATFKYLDSEQYAKIRSSKLIEQIGYSVVIGFAENKELDKRPTEIRYTSDEWQAKSMFAFPASGRMPLENNEVALDSIVLEKLGIPCKLGEKVDLEYSVGDKKVKDTFTLVGYWKGDIVIPASEIWVSPNYGSEKIKNYKEDKTIGTINADVQFNTKYFIEDKVKEVVKESGLDEDEVEYGINWAYKGTFEDTSLSSIIAMVSLMIVIGISGYLIISNIFYISITKDVQFYGLLKAVGMTYKQIKSMIKKQSLILCAIGIPIGLILGIIIGKVLTPIALTSFNVNVISKATSPLVYIGSSIFAIITVIISINKPSKLAGKVSPIEAIKRTDSRSFRKNHCRRNNKVSILNMAAQNIFRNPKKTILLVTSLSLGLIILNCTYSIFKSFDFDKFIKKSMTKDFAVADSAYFNVYKCYRGEDTLSEEFLNELYSNEGIKARGNIYMNEIKYTLDEKIKAGVEKAIVDLKMNDKKSAVFKNEIENEDLEVNLYGIDESILQELIVSQGNIDEEQFSVGKYIIVSTFDQNGKVPYYEIGDKISIDYPNGSSKEYEVLAIANIPYPISTRTCNIINVDFFIPSWEFTSNIENVTPMLTTFDVEDDKRIEIENYLNNFCSNVNKDMKYTSKQTYMEEFEGMRKTYLIIGLVLSIILSFIGIVNFVNTIITSLISRRVELAMLNSIGMTSNQQKKMLNFEGLFYVFLTTIIVTTIGSIGSYYGVKLLAGENISFTLKFTIVPSLICIVIFILFVFTVNNIAYNYVNKNSIIERLREID